MRAHVNFNEVIGWMYDTTFAGGVDKEIVVMKGSWNLLGLQF